VLVAGEQQREREGGQAVDGCGREAERGDEQKRADDPRDAEDGEGRLRPVGPEGLHHRQLLAGLRATIPAITSASSMRIPFAAVSSG
jgi:hypothetical protein